MTNKYPKIDSDGAGSVDLAIENPIVLDDGTEVYIQNTEPTSYDVWIEPDGKVSEGIFEDADGDGTFEQTTGSGISVPALRVNAPVVADTALELADTGNGSSASRMVQRKNGNIKIGDIGNQGDNTRLLYQGDAQLEVGANEVSIKDNVLTDTPGSNFTPMDVLSISSPSTGMVRYHDPSINSDGNAEGLAEYRSDGSWYSISDDSVIS